MRRSRLTPLIRPEISPMYSGGARGQAGGGAGFGCPCARYHGSGGAASELGGHQTSNQTVLASSSGAGPYDRATK